MHSYSTHHQLRARAPTRSLPIIGYRRPLWRQAVRRPPPPLRRGPSPAPTERTSSLRSDWSPAPTERTSSLRKRSVAATSPRRAKARQEELRRRIGAGRVGAASPGQPGRKLWIEAAVTRSTASIRPRPTASVRHLTLRLGGRAGSRHAELIDRKAQRLRVGEGFARALGLPTMPGRRAQRAQGRSTRPCQSLIARSLGSG